MAKKKATEPVAEVAFDVKKKVRDTAASKRAPVFEGQKAKDFYAALKESNAKLIIDQALFMLQHENGKKPFARFIIIKEFRVVLDLTE